tara:strand:- start:3045 stop:3386 length:342 start_codon:yes stop_codon:yes gene_type:complete
LEESELIPEEKMAEPSNKTENLKKVKNQEFSDFVEQKTNEDENVSNNSISTNENENINNSLFKRILENGFDGVTTNPNYKLLALLIILLINLSLFFLIGNLGKSFLANSGLLN